LDGTKPIFEFITSSNLELLSHSQACRLVVIIMSIFIVVVIMNVSVSSIKYSESDK
jgi:hypothetical protein